jgi:hypothetical protein
MSMNPTLRAILLAASLCLVTAVATARSTGMVDLGRQAIAIQPPLTDKAVHDAILAGAAVHSWKVVGDQPGVLTLEADSGQHQAVVDVSYDTQGYQITYKSSANLNYAQSDKKISIHPKYNQWIASLNAAIHLATLGAAR